MQKKVFAACLYQSFDYCLFPNNMKCKEKKKNELNVKVGDDVE